MACSLYDCANVLEQLFGEHCSSLIKEFVRKFGIEPTILIDPKDTQPSNNLKRNDGSSISGSVDDCSASSVFDRIIIKVLSCEDIVKYMDGDFGDKFQVLEQLTNQCDIQLKELELIHNWLSDEKSLFGSQNQHKCPLFDYYCSLHREEQGNSIEKLIASFLSFKKKFYEYRQWYYEKNLLKRKNLKKICKRTMTVSIDSNGLPRIILSSFQAPAYYTDTLPHHGNNRITRKFGADRFLTVRFDLPSLSLLEKVLYSENDSFQKMVDQQGGEFYNDLEPKESPGTTYFHPNFGGKYENVVNQIVALSRMLSMFKPSTSVQSIKKKALKFTKYQLDAFREIIVSRGKFFWKHFEQNFIQGKWCDIIESAKPLWKLFCMKCKHPLFVSSSEIQLRLSISREGYRSVNLFGYPYENDHELFYCLNPNCRAVIGNNFKESNYQYTALRDDALIISETSEYCKQELNEIDLSRWKNISERIHFYFSHDFFDMIAEHVSFSQDWTVDAETLFKFQALDNIVRFRRAKDSLLSILEQDLFQIAGYNFSFLTISSNGVHKKKVVYFATHGHLLHDIPRDNVLNWAISEEDIARLKKTPVKLCLRLGLLLSDTVPTINIKSEECIEIEDTKGINECILTDGCGFISPLLAQEVYDCYRKQRNSNERASCIPVFQIRFQGCKGMLVVREELSGRKLLYTKSMKKFNVPMQYTADHSTIEVIGISNPGSLVQFNSRLIYLFTGCDKSNHTEDSGIESENLTEAAFLKFAEKYWSKELISLSPNPKNLYKILENWSDYNDFNISTGDGFRETLICRFYRDNICRIRIPIPSSRRLYGVADPANILKCHQVYINISTNTKSKEIIGDVLCTKEPCQHRGDLRKFQAIGPCEKLKHLKNVIVFSVDKLLERSDPDTITGSDLDGDQYICVWEEEILKNIEIFPPQNTSVSDTTKLNLDPLEEYPELWCDNCNDKLMIFSNSCGTSNTIKDNSGNFDHFHQKLSVQVNENQEKRYFCNKCMKCSLSIHFFQRKRSFHEWIQSQDAIQFLTNDIFEAKNEGEETIRKKDWNPLVHCLKSAENILMQISVMHMSFFPLSDLNLVRSRYLEYYGSQWTVGDNWKIMERLNGLLNQTVDAPKLCNWKDLDSNISILVKNAPKISQHHHMAKANNFQTTNTVSSKLHDLFLKKLSNVYGLGENNQKIISFTLQDRMKQLRFLAQSIIARNHSDEKIIDLFLYLRKILMRKKNQKIFKVEVWDIIAFHEVFGAIYSVEKLKEKKKGSVIYVIHPRETTFKGDHQIFGFINENINQSKNIIVVVKNLISKFHNPEKKGRTCTLHRIKKNLREDFIKYFTNQILSQFFPSFEDDTLSSKTQELSEEKEKLIKSSRRLKRLSLYGNMEELWKEMMEAHSSCLNVLKHPVFCGKGENTIDSYIYSPMKDIYSVCSIIPELFEKKLSQKITQKEPILNKTTLKFPSRDLEGVRYQEGHEYKDFPPNQIAWYESNSRSSDEKSQTPCSEKEILISPDQTIQELKFKLTIEEAREMLPEERQQMRRMFHEWIGILDKAETEPISNQPVQ